MFIPKESSRIKLLKASFNKLLFKEELEKLVYNTSQDKIFDVLIYCYNKYSDMHAEVLLEVFINYKKSSNKELSVNSKSEKFLELRN